MFTISLLTPNTGDFETHTSGLPFILASSNRPLPGFKVMTHFTECIFFARSWEKWCFSATFSLIYYLLQSTGTRENLHCKIAYCNIQLHKDIQMSTRWPTPRPYLHHRETKVKRALTVHYPQDEQGDKKSNGCATEKPFDEETLFWEHYNLEFDFLVSHDLMESNIFLGCRCSPVFGLISICGENTYSDKQNTATARVSTRHSVWKTYR